MARQVSEGIFVGDLAVVTSLTRDQGFTRVIWLGTVDPLKPLPQCPGAEYFYYPLPNQELMEQEFPRIFTRLDTIANDIDLMRKAGCKILVACDDGKNRSLLACGYYLITKLRQNDVIARLEMLYFSAEQRAEDIEDAKYITAADNEEPIEETEEAMATRLARRAERRVIRGLTMNSFKKMLKLKI